VASPEQLGLLCFCSCFSFSLLLLLLLSKSGSKGVVCHFGSTLQTRQSLDLGLRQVILAQNR
jgi:hypothetical protein